MEQVTQELLAACVELRSNTRMQVLLAWLRTSGERSANQLLYSDSDRHCAALQGETRVLAEIVDVIDRAPERLRDFESVNNG
jgi:hypothetical protein